nr:hypothetical protein [Tanacetum cinerariifolium]
KTFPVGFFRRTQIDSSSPDLSDLLYHSPSLAATLPFVTTTVTTNTTATATSYTTTPLHLQSSITSAVTHRRILHHPQIMVRFVCSEQEVFGFWVSSTWDGFGFIKTKGVFVWSGSSKGGFPFTVRSNQQKGVGFTTVGVFVSGQQP